MVFQGRTHQKTKSFKQSNTHVCALTTSLPAKILRMIMVFTLAFFSTWHLQYSYAYGDENDGNSTTEQPAASNENESGSTGSGNSDSQPTTYTVSFNPANGILESDPSGNYTEGSTITLPNATYEGYVFQGWSWNGNNYSAGIEFPVNENLSFTASWQEKEKFTIDFDPAGGVLESDPSGEYEAGAVITLPGVTLEDNNFLYWDTAEFTAGSSYVVTESRTFTAKWEKNSITYSYINNLEILPETMENEEEEYPEAKDIPAFEDGATLTLDGKEKRTYQLRARISITDALSNGETKDADNSPVIISGSLADMKISNNKAAEGEESQYFSDLTWEITSATDEKGEDVSGNEDLVKLDEKTGELTIAPGVKVGIRCTTPDGEAGELQKELIAELPSSEVKPVNIITISYDANGGEGTVQATVSDGSEEVTLAGGEGLTAPQDTSSSSSSSDSATSTESSAEGEDATDNSSSSEPKKKTYTFKGWNTAADGKGTPLDAEGTYKIEDLIALAEEVTDSESSENLESGASSNATQTQATKHYKLTLYADWDDAEEDNEDSIDGEEFDGNARIDISYHPVPKGKFATLKPVIYGVGRLSFAYVWERSTDGGATWSRIESTGLTEHRVMTDDESIGKHQYRVSMYADKIIDDDNILTSSPVTITEGTSDYVQLTYNTVKQGETTEFAVEAGTDFTDGTFTWYMSDDNGATFSRIKGANGRSYAVITNEDYLGNMFRVVAKSKDGEKTAQDTVTLVALDPDHDPIDTETPMGKDDNNGGGGTSPNAPGDESNRIADDSNNPGPAEYDDNYEEATEELEPGDPRGDSGNAEIYDSPDGEPIEDANDFDGYGPWIDNSDTEFEAQGPTPAPEPVNIVPYNDPTLAEESPETPADPAIDIIVDPEVSQKIAAEQPQTQNPGQKWHELSVMPKPEEIKQVLDSNPLAPFVAPLIIAFLACGMMERYFAYRRQTQASTVSFA